jgi:hypothetical protein
MGLTVYPGGHFRIETQAPGGPHTAAVSLAPPPLFTPFSDLPLSHQQARSLADIPKAT